MHMNEFARHTIKFSNVEELLAGLPAAFDFCQGKTGMLYMQPPRGDWSGYFTVIEVPGVERAPYLVGATLIQMLYAEQIPQHYMVVCQAWQNLRDAQWRRERNTK